MTTTEHPPHRPPGRAPVASFVAPIRDSDTRRLLNEWMDAAHIDRHSARSMDVYDHEGDESVSWVVGEFMPFDRNGKPVVDRHRNTVVTYVLSGPCPPLPAALRGHGIKAAA